MRASVPVPDDQVVGLTRVLADFAAGGAEALSDHTAEVTRALVDTVGVAVASTAEPAERMLQSWAVREGSTGRATVWTTGRSTSASMAALLNGTSGHQLDYDDISPSTPMHPSTVLVPALLAAAEDRALDGSRVVEAYDVGAATFRAVAELLPQHVHYARGWHTTATVGRLAAVAALVRLTGACSETAQHALGIVSSLVAGSRLNFGSMTKPLHAGCAARDAVMAFELAESGFTANPDELEAPDGFFERYGDPDLAPVGDPSETLAERLEHWVEAWPGDWGIKRYAACYGTHRGVDAALELRSRVDPAAVQAITVTVHPRGTRALVAFPPESATEAKFSLEYTVASALVRGPLRLADFEEASFADAGVRELMGKVVVSESADPPTGPASFSGGYAVVEVVDESGRQEVARVDLTRGDARDPLSDRELLDKFADCCQMGGFSHAASARLHRALTDFVGGGHAGALVPALSRDPQPAVSAFTPTSSAKELTA
jgi:2-methylcitrate dehydratase PrpD